MPLQQLKGFHGRQQHCTHISGRQICRRRVYQLNRSAVKEAHTHMRHTKGRPELYVGGKLGSEVNDPIEKKNLQWTDA